MGSECRQRRGQVSEPRHTPITEVRGRQQRGPRRDSQVGGREQRERVKEASRRKAWSAATCHRRVPSARPEGQSLDLRGSCRRWSCGEAPVPASPSTCLPALLSATRRQPLDVAPVCPALPKRLPFPPSFLTGLVAWSQAQAPRSRHPLRLLLLQL